jgi:hypothetical protein
MIGGDPTVSLKRTYIIRLINFYLSQLKLVKCTLKIAECTLKPLSVHLNC